MFQTPGREAERQGYDVWIWKKRELKRRTIRNVGRCRRYVWQAGRSARKKQRE